MTEQKIPGWYDTPGAMQVLEVSKVAISKIAKSNAWQSQSLSNGSLHRAEDVHEYRDHQIRTELVTALGWKGRGKYRVTDIDISCPECDAYAIEWPAPPDLAEKYLCIKGHEGQIENA